LVTERTAARPPQRRRGGLARERPDRLVSADISDEAVAAAMGGLDEPRAAASSPSASRSCRTLSFSTASPTKGTGPHPVEQLLLDHQLARPFEQVFQHRKCFRGAARIVCDPRHRHSLTGSNLKSPKAVWVFRVITETLLRHDNSVMTLRGAVAILHP
jgi:hypothetical protein